MSNYSDAVHYLTTWGLKEPVAEGVVDVLSVESEGLDPTAEDPREGAYGIAQWTDARKEGLRNYAASRRENPETLEAQLHWLVQELNTSEVATREALKRATSRKQAIEIWVRLYERPENDQTVIEAAERVEGGALGPAVTSGAGATGTLAAGLGAAAQTAEGVHRSVLKHDYHEKIVKTGKAASEAGNSMAGHTRGLISLQQHLPSFSG
jgi:hypothetical protein